MQCRTADAVDCHVVLPIEISGAIQMDFNSDRLSDFMVYYLSQTTGKYEEYMHLPLSAAAHNITDCMPWMVGLYDAVYMYIITLILVVLHVTLGYW